MIRQTTIKNLPRTASVAEGRRDKERRIEGERRRQGKPTSKPSRRSPSWRGASRKGENQHEMERWHNPQSREGGKCLLIAENAYQIEIKITCMTKKIRQKHTVLCHSMSSQITLAAPRLGAEEDVGRAGTKKRTRKTYSPVPQFSGPIAQTMSQH